MVSVDSWVWFRLCYIRRFKEISDVIKWNENGANTVEKEGKQQ